MRSDEHAEVVTLQEGVQVVWAEVHDVILFKGIADVVMLESTDFFAFVWIAPEKIDDLLVVLNVVRTKLDFEWSLNFFDTFNVSDLGANTSMTTENTLLLISNNNCEWKVIESIIDLSEAAVGVVDILLQSLGALVSKAEVFIDVAILVVSSQHHDLLWVFEFEGHEQADYFKTVLTLVNVVSEEEVVKSVNISILKWELPDIEESHQIDVLSV